MTDKESYLLRSKANFINYQEDDDNELENAYAEGDYERQLETVKRLREEGMNDEFIQRIIDIPLEDSTLSDYTKEIEQFSLWSILGKFERQALIDEGYRAGLAAAREKKSAVVRKLREIGKSENMISYAVDLSLEELKQIE